MDKGQILRQSTFGRRVAEDENETLERYYVLTDHWESLYHGDVDIVYGPKGAGKSALYWLLNRKQAELRENGIIIVSAENPDGAPVFRDVGRDPLPSEAAFKALWKLYFLTLINSVLRDSNARSEEAALLSSYLEGAGLVPAEWNLTEALKNVFSYVSSFKFSAGSIAEIEVHTEDERDTKGKTAKNALSADQLLRKANAALEALECEVWILLDRLDAAFEAEPELEEGALRMLLKTYLDMRGLQSVSLKILLRNDVWNRIARKGFKEAANIARATTIRWDRSSLLNLVVRRVLDNSAIVDAYSAKEEKILASEEEQEAFFHRVFPEQMGVTSDDKPIRTFDWIVERTRDGSSPFPAPREVIHLLNAARSAQLKQHKVGKPADDGESLFSAAALREALPEVSTVRLEQTLYAEFPDLRRYIEDLAGRRMLQSPESLAEIWQCDREAANRIAKRLTEVGFFERRGGRRDPKFWIPFLYRHAAEIYEHAGEE